MRKTLLQTLLCAFCAILAPLLGMGGGGMMLGARFAMGGRPWRNPYVTDGLVAMWDGEWNAGPGKHDPNATVWRDLMSEDRVWNMTDCEVTRNSFAFNGETSLALLNSDEYGWMRGCDLTTEFVVRFDSRADGAWQPAIAMDCPDNSSYESRRIELGYNPNNLILNLKQKLHYGVNLYKAAVYGIDPGRMLGNPHSFVSLHTEYANDVTDFMFDGNRIAPNSGEYFSNNQRFVLGARLSSGKWYNGFFGEMYSLRIYRRLLAEAEIARNYVVDRERFGLEG